MYVFLRSPSAPLPPSSVDKGVTSSLGDFFPWQWLAGNRHMPTLTVRLRKTEHISFIDVSERAPKSNPEEQILGSEDRSTAFHTSAVKGAGLRQGWAAMRSIISLFLLPSFISLRRFCQYSIGSMVQTWRALCSSGCISGVDRDLTNACCVTDTLQCNLGTNIIYPNPWHKVTGAGGLTDSSGCSFLFVPHGLGSDEMPSRSSSLIEHLFRMTLWTACLYL